MKTIPKWADKIQDADKNSQCVYDLCFHPNGNLIIVASGLQVLIYSTEDGSLIHALKGHKENVYCVCAAKDGKKFASGSADKTVIIWNASFEGILKYSHNDAVQCLAYNPTSSTLASCAISDFAFWSQEQKSVQKHKSNVRINACSWTNDGQYIALGLSNGSVSIRNKAGEEKSRIDRPGGNDAAIWTLQWSPSHESENVDILCVADWGKNLSFYTLGGKLVGKERVLGFEPLRVSYFPSSEYILVAGTNKTCVLFTKEGIKLSTIGEPQQHWVWCCAAHPTANYVAIGCQDGTLAYYQLVFSTVHSLYRERYAFRDNMTDVIIQHLLTDQKVRIKCRDLIKKIAIYKHRLAVQLPERVVIYELNGSESDNMHYRVREKIGQHLDCNLLVVCSEHLVVCQERKLLGLTFSGARYRDWLLESVIRYIKVIGGAPGKEGLVLGLKNGQIWKIHIDSTTPIFLLSVSESVRCLDLSSQRNMIAVVDDNLVCHVFNIETGELLYQEHDTNSVAWNTCYEDMLCFSGDSTLGIRVTGFSANRQCHTGLVVGFTANKAFCLQGNSMTSIQLPLSTSMYQYLGKKMFTDAFNVACLGVTESDWEELAATALENLELEVARQAYIRLQDIHHLDLIHELQERQRKGEHNLELLKAQVLAFRGKFKEAARLYQRLGHNQKAVAMYTDLRMFDHAQDFLESTNDMDQKALIRQKADWAKNINEPRAAAEMYLAVGDTRSAIEIMAEHGWSEMLVDLGRRLDKADKAHLMLVAEHLRRLRDIPAAGEVYRRLGDDAALLSLHVEARQWPQAFALAERQPQHKQLVYVPYAQWLAENDRFIEAQKAFHKAGRPEEALRVLKQLIENAVHENRYQDAGFLYWMLARQCLDMNDSADPKQTRVNIAKFHQNEKLAAIYYAYQILHSYLEEPFTSYMPDGLFNIARFVMNETKDIKAKGVSQFTVLYSLSKQARILGAHKLTRQLLDKIRLLRIPARLQESVEVATLTARTKPHHDPEELLPMCYRCSTYNALLSVTGNTCLHCRQPFVHSFLTFEILPLVEFELEPDISDADAVRLIEAPPPESTVDDKGDGWVQNIEENQETLQFDESPKTVEDSFTARLSNFQAGSENFVAVTVNRSILQAMDPSTVLICKWPPPLRYQYYKNCLPEWQIRLCDSCFKAFHIEDFELQVIQKEFCPFCRAPVDVSNGMIKTEELPDENIE